MTEIEGIQDTTEMFAHLTGNRAWQRLYDRGQGSDRCDPFRALGIARREQSYSSVLAWLLRERRCAAFAAAWLDAVLAPSATPPGRSGRTVTDLDGQALKAVDLTCQSVASELPLPSDERIDLVAQYSTSGGRHVVLAVENKIHAGESPGQLDSYVRELLRQYRDDHTTIVVVFLTPAGRAPISLGDAGADNDRLHVRLASWAGISTLLGEYLPDTENEEHRQFARMVSRHLQEGLMGETPDRKDTRALFEDPDCARTLLRIYEQQPQLGDMRDAWVERVRAWLEEWDRSWTEIDSRVYPTTRGRKISEIKIKVQAWDDAGIPLRFMVHNDTDHGGPAVRILIYINHYAGNEQTLARLAELSDGAIDAEYERAWPGFPWLRVLASDRESNEPVARQVEHYAYNATTIEHCLTALDQQFRKIEPAIRQFLVEGAGE